MMLRRLLFECSIATALCSTWPCLAGSNEFFITTFSNGRHPDDVAASKSAIECQPSEVDWKGNWGHPSQGFQLSIRFDREVYDAGEPILATVLLRNISGANLEYRDVWGLERDYKFVVVNPRGTALPDQTDYSRGKGWSRTLFVGTQHKSQVKLDSRYLLNEPGEYVISVSRVVPMLEENGHIQWSFTNQSSSSGAANVVTLNIPVPSENRTEVSSGNAIIRILKGAGVSPQPAHEKRADGIAVMAAQKTTTEFEPVASSSSLSQLEERRPPSTASPKSATAPESPSLSSPAHVAVASPGVESAPNVSGSGSGWARGLWPLLVLLPGAWLAWWLLRRRQR